MLSSLSTRSDLFFGVLRLVAVLQKTPRQVSAEKSCTSRSTPYRNRFTLYRHNMGFTMMLFFNPALFIYFFFFGGLMAQKEGPLYIQHADEIIHSFEKECVKEFKGFKLRSIGSGGGFAHDVEEIDVKFFAYEPATIEEARALEVTLTEKLLKKINEHEKIRPYLREYPFPSNRAEVSVSFHKRNGDYYTDGSVAYVSQIRNKIGYCAADPKTEKFIDLLEEPYEDALKLVQQK